MFSTDTHSARPGRRASRGGALAALALGFVALGIACSGSPTSPTLDTFSSERRVQTGGGGGTLCQPPVCPGFDGRLEILAGGGTLSGRASGAQIGNEPTRFELRAELTGTGRFGDGFIDVVFDREEATVRTIWFTRSGQIYQDTNVTGTPAYTETPEKSCPSGTLLEARLTVTLENFGRTEIIERHCVPEP